VNVVLTEQYWGIAAYMYILFFLAITSIPLCGMTPENAALMTGMPLLGYDIENGIDKFRLMFPEIEKKFDERRDFRKKELLEAVKEEFEKTRKFNESTLVFNPACTACGWLQSFCTYCLSPNRCDCGERQIPGALYRAQFSDIGDCHIAHNHTWRCTRRLLVHKACIASSILAKIVEHNANDKRRGIKNPHWDQLAIPTSKDIGKTWVEQAFISSIFFNSTDECAILEYRSRYRDAYIENYSVVRSITPHGETKLRNLEFALDNTGPCDATLILQNPALLDKCAESPNKGYSDAKVTISMHEVLSTAYKFSASHIALFHRIISDTVRQHEFLAAARCAQIFDFHGKARQLLLLYNDHANAKILYPTVIGGSPQPVLSFYPLGSIYDERRHEIRRCNIDIYSQQLSEYTLDTVDKFDEARKNELECLEHNSKYFVNYKRDLLEIRCLHSSSFMLTIVRPPCTSEHSTFFVNTSWCGEVLGKVTVTYFSEYNPYREDFSILALVLGSVLYTFKSTTTETEAGLPQKIPLLTEKETESGYVIERDSSFDRMGSPIMELYLKPVHWWEHIFRPCKTVNIAKRSLEFTHQRELSYLTIMSSLQALCRSIVDACLRVLYYGF
jgi:hypothetical protein